MSDCPKEAAFQKHLDRTTKYFNTIRENGDLPWFEVGNPKRDERAAELELPQDISDEGLRRAVFFRRYK